MRRCHDIHGYIDECLECGRSGLSIYENEADDKIKWIVDDSINDPSCPICGSSIIPSETFIELGKNEIVIWNEEFE